MRYAVLSIMLFSLCGCGVELLTTTAVQGELQAQQATAMKRQLGKAAEQVGRTNLEAAVRTYQAERGVYPPNLEALMPDYLPAIPTQSDGSPYGYNPDTGRILDAPFLGETAADRRLMGAIGRAIDRYGQATGYYPAGLDDLVPDYLSTPPRTAGGESFLYNNQDGSVRHPHAQAQPRRQAGAAQGRRGVGQGYSDRQMQAVEELGL